MTAATVTVLNASYEHFQKVSFEKAVRMLNRKVAEVVEDDPNRTIGQWRWPKVIRLIRYVYEKWLDRPARWHKGGVHIRDGHRCAYCGKKSQSIDHIRPQKLGGEWSWMNCVAACHDCNGRKKSMTLEASGMKLRFATPYVPTVRELIAKGRPA